MFGVGEEGVFYCLLFFIFLFLFFFWQSNLLLCWEAFYLYSVIYSDSSIVLPSFSRVLETCLYWNLCLIATSGDISRLTHRVLSFIHLNILNLFTISSIFNLPTVPRASKATVRTAKRHHHRHIHSYLRGNCRRWSRVSQRRWYIHPPVQRSPPFLNRYPRVLAHRFEEPCGFVGLNHR